MTLAVTPTLLKPVSCQKCGQPTRPAQVNGRPAFVCLACQEWYEDLPGPNTQTPEHLNTRTPAQPRRKNSSGLEEDVQAEIIKELTARGYRVLQASVRYKCCWNCGERQRGGTGQTPGIPDLLVTYDGWAKGVFIGLEVKSASGRPTDAQKELLGRGLIFLVRNVGEALAAVEGTRGGA